MIAKIKRYAAAFLALIIMPACTETGAIVANMPSYVSLLPLDTNVPYGRKSTNKLDIYGTKTKNAPVLVFFYGGSWQDGNKELYSFVGDHFAKQGYIVVIPDYSKYPAVKYPVFVEEGAQAVNWTLNNIENYGGNSDQLFLMGHSAGAHTAAMLAADERYGLQNKVTAFVGLSGPYDFVPKAKDIKAVFEGTSNEDMQVTTFIDGTESPFFLVHGGADTIVGEVNLQKLKASIQDESGTVKTKIYLELDHAGTVKAITWMFDHKSSLTNDVDAFMKDQLK